MRAISLILFLLIVPVSEVFPQCLLEFHDPLAGEHVPVSITFSDTTINYENNKLAIDSAMLHQRQNESIKLKFEREEYYSVYNEIICNDIECLNPMRFDTITLHHMCTSDTNVYYLASRFIPYKDIEELSESSSNSESIRNNSFCSYSSEEFSLSSSKIITIVPGSPIFEIYRDIRNLHGIIGNINLDIKISSDLGSPAVCIPGNKGQTVLIDSAYCMSLFSDRSHFREGLTILLAHEIQHAVKGDLLEWNDRQNNPTFKVLQELEADWMSGYLAQKMGLSRKSIQFYLDKLITNNSPSRSHPSKSARVNMVLAGWLDSFGEKVTKNRRKDEVWLKKYDHNESYIGEVNGKKQRDGFGVYHYSDDDWYIGQWNNSLREGFALAIYKEDHLNFEGITEGEYVHDHFSKGIWFESSGLRRIGSFLPYRKKDEISYYQSGFGMLSYIDSPDSINQYFGFISHNLPDSLGLSFTWSSNGDPELKAGIWQEGELHQDLEMEIDEMGNYDMFIRNADGSVYFGETVSGVPFGLGASISFNQVLFGEWDDGYLKKEYSRSNIK